MKDGIALNIGCGPDIRSELKGFKCVNIDCRSLPGVDKVADVRNLSDIPDGNINYILASDIIEHFPISETESLLKEWSRVLCVGGVLEIRTPNLKFIVNHYKATYDAKFASWHLFGGQDYPENFHYVIFDGKWLTSLCEKFNLRVINYNEVGSNFILEVEKY